MYKQWLNDLKKSELFNGIESDGLYAMLNCLKPKITSYKKNEILTIENNELKAIGLVLEGLVMVTKESSTGNRSIIAILEKGDLFGETTAFSGMKLWPATVIAKEECVIMYLPQEKIVGSCSNSCDAHRTLIINMLRIISDRALLFKQKVEYLTLKSLRKRISMFLLNFSKKNGKSTFMLPMDRNELAEFLNVSRPSLSREMCKMRDEGLIDFHKSSIKIIDVEALQQIPE